MEGEEMGPVSVSRERGSGSLLRGHSESEGTRSGENTSGHSEEDFMGAETCRHGLEEDAALPSSPPHPSLASFIRQAFNI